jgi:hypothetical protein
MDGRMRSLRASHLTGLSHINEPELDMHRHRGIETGTLGRVYGMIRKLISDRRSIVPPMRSIGRELEESWPTGDL